MAFAAWTGKRLPFEEEWEAASRTSRGCIYPWGNVWQSDACNIEASCIGDTTPVDRYIQYANDLGIVDVIGNVWEWTLNRDTHSGEKDRQNTMKHKVKGGCWASGNAVTLVHSDIMEPKTCSNVVGFRCVAY